MFSLPADRFYHKEIEIEFFLTGTFKSGKTSIISTYINEDQNDCVSFDPNSLFTIKRLTIENTNINIRIVKQT